MLRFARCMRLLTTLCFLGTPLVFAATADDWRNRTIYQLVTDRFATSDNSGPPCDTSDRQYCGGTWKGIISKLDYIQDMGFDAVWISPVVANVDGNTSYGEAFHGYWTQDITTLNPHFGTENDLKSLSAALHNRSMYLMVDVVVNHFVSATDPPDYSGFLPFSSESDFHPECVINDYNDQTEVEQCWLGDSKLHLVDLNTEDDSVVKDLYSWIQKLVHDYSIDGLRIDTVRHIRKDFWPGFTQAAGVFTIGEVLDDEPSYVAPYTKVIDGVLDYPTWFPLISAFQNTSGNLTALAAKVWEAQALYMDGEMLTGSFLENHDQTRFQSITQDEALIRNAMTWPFVQSGIPILYYGQEQGYQGGQDPANREALWLSEYAEDKPLVTFVKMLNAARRAAIAKNSKFLTTPATLYAVTPSTLAVSRPPMLALLTNLGSDAVPTWNVPDAGYAPHERLVDVLTCTAVVANKHGGLLVQGSHGNPQILLPMSALSETGTFCSNMATSHGIASAAASRPHPLGLMNWLVADAVPIAVTLAVVFLAGHSNLFIG